ncbi:MinD/ParA family ATP-binding protein [Halorubrum kocurii]|uniref:MinD/ParA family ATP-binding protein n=1 Tax=Halorubrum kocurii TaxID=478441 RepID=UPI0006775EB4|nr:P-loop NTPase [Halorubrum kocurii]
MIAVAGGKGGSGKTTTTLGLARALSRRGAPVVAADADWDLPNLARLASATADGGEPAARAPTVVDAVRPAGELRPDRRGPTVLSAPDRPGDLDAGRVLGALAEAAPDDSPTLLDCPAGASPDAAAPLRVADRCLLATPLRRAALRDAAKTAALARRLDCPPVGVVAVRAESVPDGVGDLLGCPVLGRVPPADPEPLAAPSVRSAHDDLASRIVDEYGADRWRVA